MIPYTEHVKKIAERVIFYLEKERTDGYDPFDDEDLVYECVNGTTFEHGTVYHWYGTVSSRYGNPCEDMLFQTAQMIAGNSPSIEKSFEGQYRKDMFRDVALGALLNDVIIEIKLTHPEIVDPEFCDRAR